MGAEHFMINMIIKKSQFIASISENDLPIYASGKLLPVHILTFRVTLYIASCIQDIPTVTCLPL